MLHHVLHVCFCLGSAFNATTTPNCCLKKYAVYRASYAFSTHNFLLRRRVHDKVRLRERRQHASSQGENFRAWRCMMIQGQGCLYTGSTPPTESPHKPPKPLPEALMPAARFHWQYRQYGGALLGIDVHTSVVKNVIIHNIDGGQASTPDTPT